MSEKRSGFTGRIGFVLAAAGSAVGLGNIWRFPYLAEQYGGGIFLLVYLILAITFGFSLMCAEIAIGRKTGMSAISAFAKLNKKYSFIGVLAAIVPAIILPYYSVIGGWVTKYSFEYFTGGAHEVAGDSFFGNFIGSTWAPLIFFLIFIGITALVVMGGVEKGVENVSKFMMPILVILILIIAGYTLFVPEIRKHIGDYFIPDFSSLTAGSLVKTILGAMGQLFYSMSLAMGIMITYGSYMKKDNHIEKAVHQIEWFDTGIAFLAGFIIVPAAAAFSGGVNNSGPGLMFATLPKVFEKMPGGTIVGAAFFILVLFAALTSSISLMETVVSIICDKFKLSRMKSCVIVLIGAILLGLPSSLGFGVWSHIMPLNMDLLTFFDFISNSVLMPIVALLTCIFIGYVLKPKALIDEIEKNGRFGGKGLFVVVIKYFAPVCIIAILASSVADGLLKAFTGVGLF
ncbi:MAG: sodium-dependent transporter [Clostridia bacterium]|nr:sodium-dependent transporter [Clostridia bacterium]